KTDNGGRATEPECAEGSQPHVAVQNYAHKEVENGKTTEDRKPPLPCNTTPCTEEEISPASGPGHSRDMPDGHVVCGLHEHVDASPVIGVHNRKSRLMAQLAEGHREPNEVVITPDRGGHGQQ